MDNFESYDQNPVSNIYTLNTPKKDEQILELFAIGIIEEELDVKVLFDVLKMELQLLKLETPAPEDIAYHNIRCWIIKNLIISITDEGFIDTSCDTDTEEILTKFSWIIRYLVQIHSMVMTCNFKSEAEIKRLMKKVLYLLKADIYFGNRTDSKVDISNIIEDAINDAESS